LHVLVIQFTRHHQELQANSLLEASMTQTQQSTPFDLNAHRILDEAASATGLSDWGDGPFRVALGVLVEAIKNEARLSPQKLQAAHGRLVGLLSNRLRIVGDRSRFPEIAKQRIEKPLIILG